MIVSFDSKDLTYKLNNIVKYSLGFLDGAQAGKPKLMTNLGESILESLKGFIDANARVNPESLHHVYEWYQTGSPESRLFDIQYIITNNTGISFNYTFSQSRSYSNGSKEPFYNKAQIMENGTPVTIKPKAGGVLSFNIDGEQIFTRKPIVISNPGGEAVEGGFERTIKTFFDSYFTQSYIISSGILGHLNDMSTYKKNFAMGAKQGKSLGFKTGYNWITKGGKLE